MTPCSVARKGNNIRFNFEISTHIKNKRTLVHRRHLLNILTKFRDQTFVVGDLLTALKLTVGYREDALVLTVINLHGIHVKVALRNVTFSHSHSHSFLLYQKKCAI